MPLFWLDACVFIEAKNGPYSFSRVPSFWRLLDEQSKAGAICCPDMVYKELVSGNDQLARWVSARKQNGLCVKPNRAVQELVTKIADYVTSDYKQHQAAAFLAGADAWLIAHAWQSEGIVVTQESDRQPKAEKARIPDVCANFSVGCTNTYEMLDGLGASF